MWARAAARTYLWSFIRLVLAEDHLAEPLLVLLLRQLATHRFRRLGTCAGR